MSQDFSKFRARYIPIDFLLISIVVAILLGVISLATGLDSDILAKNPIVEWSLSSLMVIGICLGTLWRLRKSGIEPRHLIGSRSFRGIPWMMLAIVFYGIETLEAGISQLTIFFSHLIAPSFTKSAVADISLELTFKTDSLALKVLFYILIFFGVVILAPLAEEFFFRGVLLHRFATKWGITAGILVSSALFGLAHVNIHSIAIGVSFIFIAIVYLKFPSLLVPITYHAVHNLIAVVSGLIMLIAPQANATDISVQYLWQGLLNTGFALPILWYFLKWPSPSDLLPYTINSKTKSALS